MESTKYDFEIFAGEHKLTGFIFPTWEIEAVACDIRSEADDSVLWSGALGTGFELVDDGFDWELTEEETTTWAPGAYRYDVRATVGGKPYFICKKSRITVTEPQTRDDA